jgi:hypothetical protein
VHFQLSDDTCIMRRLTEVATSQPKTFTGREGSAMLDEMWLPTLNTNSPQEGFELAVKLSRLAVMVSQSCDDNRQRAQPMQPDDASQLIGAAHVIALNFQTIAAANDWWRHPSADHN